MKKLMMTIGLLTALNANSANVDLGKSSLVWTASKITGDKHTGTLKIKKGSLKKNNGEIIVDMNSLDVTDLKGEWRQKFIGHVKSADFFTVEKFPTAKIKIKKLEKGKLHGDLTIKGKTNPITMDYKKDGKTYSGDLTFDRTKFDLIYGSANFFKNLGDKVINDSVNLKVKIVLK